MKTEQIQYHLVRYHDGGDCSQSDTAIGDASRFCYAVAYTGDTVIAMSDSAPAPASVPSGGLLAACRSHLTWWVINRPFGRYCDGRIMWPAPSEAVPVAAPKVDDEAFAAAAAGWRPPTGA